MKRFIVNRDWGLLERLKEEQRVHRFRDQGAQATLEMAAALHEHARATSPGFPSEHARKEDLEQHVRLKQLLEQASRALSIR